MKYLIGWSALFISTWGLTAPAQAANPDHLQRLLNTNQCPNCDLTGADLSEANLFGANLINANLTGANLGGANLMDANLTDTILDNAYLYEAELIDTTLTGASLNGVYLRKAELPNVSLRRGQLVGANLAEANLAGVDLRGANLRNATLHHAKFSGIDLSAMGLDAVAMGSSFYFATFFQATFCTTDMPPALEDDREIPPGSLILAQLEGANLSGANLSGAFLVGANLQNANLRSADLRSACLTYAQLQGADLSNSQLEHTNFTRATIENARFTGAEDADLSLAYQTEADAQRGRDEVKLRPLYAEARNNVGALMRGQQAYYLENEEFTEDLQSLGLGIRFDQEHYDYGTTLIENGVVIFAQAQQSNLQSVLAVVSVDTDEGMTFADLCWSSDPTQTIPAIAGLPEDLNDFVCPEGWEGRDY